MSWLDARTVRDEDGVKKYDVVELVNDRREVIASIMQFYEGGPFYSAAVDPREPNVMRRIGPITGPIENAKTACERVCSCEGPDDLHKRAGYGVRKVGE